METFRYRLSQVYLEKWPLERERERERERALQINEYERGAVEERITEADDAVASSDDELAGLELSDGGHAHVEALLDGRQRAAQLLHGDVDYDDVTGRRADVQVLVLGVDLTHTHARKLVKRNCRCDTRLYFFSQRVINRWNSLSQEDVDASSINCFKNRLEKRRTRQMDFFKDT